MGSEAVEELVGETVPPEGKDLEEEKSQSTTEKKKDNPTLEEERSSSIPVAIPTLLTSSSMLRPTLKGKSNDGEETKKIATVPGCRTSPWRL